MASSTSSTDPLEAKLDKVKAELKDWTFELKEAQALLVKAKSEGDVELMDEARECMATAKERITAAKRDIARVDDEIEMYRKAIMDPHAAAARTGRFLTSTLVSRLFVFH